MNFETFLIKMNFIAYSKDSKYYVISQYLKKIP